MVRVSLTEEVTFEQRSHKKLKDVREGAIGGIRNAFQAAGERGTENANGEL